MKITSTTISGVYTLEIEPVHDNRGFFARTFCMDELGKAGLVTSFPQCNVSYNAKKATLRGMHYQIAPFGETKIVRCTSGSVYDVVVDIRPSSPTFKKWYGVELSFENRRSIYIPEGIAHGFISLVDGAELLYMMSAKYQPEAARGVRWNDPAFAIEWPLTPSVIADRDNTFSGFSSSQT
ncbi:MAG: dTDP-4-dehydrorhamnose 3,5-epimerase [Fibrobacteres bacterium]|nr:dTDP-4-dehydrorhamnose 3,5-epimerase [Fibrobacterota bacterium]